MKKYLGLAALLLLTGCAGTMKSCSSWSAEEFGSDWLITQNRADGTPFNCWKLRNVSVSNEPHSDGIFWKMPSGNLVHISGFYTKTQVSGSNWVKAAEESGVDLKRCDSGAYKPAPAAPVTPPSPPVPSDYTMPPVPRE